MTKAHKKSISGQPISKVRAVQEHTHDTYKPRAKLRDGTACPQCGVVFRGGRWRWEAKAAGAPEAVCPACQRIRDRYPAGILTIAGELPKAQREELLHLVRNEEREQRAEHPLSRIIEIAPRAGATEITTTDVHMVRRLGDAIQRTYHGRLEMNYLKDQDLIRARWERAAP
jgi:NMD protein affecting ribosome stability and mRNA decay